MEKMIDHELLKKLEISLTFDFNFEPIRDLFQQRKILAEKIKESMSDIVITISIRSEDEH